jgi:hypothetical protein
LPAPSEVGNDNTGKNTYGQVQDARFYHRPFGNRDSGEIMARQEDKRLIAPVV